jgi:glycosyltransferase involved in cell wall biosynthesis
VSLRLLVIVETFGDARGTDVFCNALAEALRRRHHVTTIAASASGPDVEETDGVIRLGPSVLADSDALGVALASRVAVDGFDLVYNLSGLSFGNTVALTLLATHPALPLVNHFQALLGSYAGEEGWGAATVDFNQEGQRDIAEQAALNIFLSQSEYRDALEAGFDLSRGVASVIPAGVRAEDVATVEARDWLPPSRRRAGARPTVFLAAGRFNDYVKGGDLVYRAFTYLHRRNPDVFLVAVSNSRRFASLLQELPPDAYTIVDWLPRPEFLATVAGVDVVVVPSRYESFGLIAVEAMMLGKPVIANNVGGLNEIVHHGRTGVLNDLREGSFGLYRALQLFAADPALAGEMGRAAQRYATREFDLERICDLVDRNLAATIVRSRSLASRVPWAR